MKCPVCKDIDLVMSERQGVEIDYCPSCRGVWLDRGELDKIIEKSSTYQSNNHSNYFKNDDRNSYNFVMKDDDGNEIATLQTETYNEYKHGVFDIEVKPEFRRKGLATKLFMYAKKYLKNKLIELVHSADNLSDDGRAFKNSFSSIYVDYTSLDELKQFMKQFLQNKSCGLNINELDSIFVYRELINWLQKNAKKELNVISKILKI